MTIKRFKNKLMNKKAKEITHSFKAEVSENGVNEITIYGDIGDAFFWESTSASDVKNALKDMTGDVTINLNSPGGDAFDGIAIYNTLKSHDGKITVNVDGWAASAASIIAMAADELIMNTGTMMMVHEASTIAFGSKKEMKSTLNALEGLDQSLADIYMTRFKGERSEIETCIENETWFTASEAVDLGLADKVVEQEGTDNDPEAFKNSLLERFKNKDQTDQEPNKNILNKFKRQ